MKINASGYPLSWPVGWKRTDAMLRRYGSFGHRGRGVTVDEACGRIIRELRRMGVPDYQVIVSSNLQLRRDGLPRSDQRAPADTGAAVYWIDGDAERCIAIDHYARVEENLAAIAATLEAMRAIERHGGAGILNRAFTGFTALPAPGQTTARGWREILGVTPSESNLAVAQDKYRRLAAVHHPDKGGAADAMAELNWAWAQAQEALK